MHRDRALGPGCDGARPENSTILVQLLDSMHRHDAHKSGLALISRAFVHGTTIAVHDRLSI
jgi:hypothetical protein